VTGAGTGNSRRTIDRVLLVFIIACLGIAVVRFGIAAVVVSTSAVAERRQPAPDEPPDTSYISGVLWRFRNSPLGRSWWGLRPLPSFGGGDYLYVVSHHTAARTLGSVIGVVAEKDSKKGIKFRQVLVPYDRTALYGETPGLLVQDAEGAMDRTEWASLATDVGAFSDVPVVKKRYDPVLTKEQLAAVAARTHLVKRAESVYVGKPGPGASGTWIVFARVRPLPLTREYLLIPLEASPLGGVK
jgi:hypothetical protein